ncbi:DUF3465 domain-containing protein [Acetobacter fallax]|uniref:DUF3465 domain-containing protein n=2 Tax=Acetobacter fallax TaxID=1737473 RepID=A0ABX0KB08_9PROT|nr:DUF3465 domain-containing protein [Acetobacter fallax]NHO33589.1 DUF3465 domain-containing protein [Acetobacter fallax]NHO37165.1 DUF3465 domain-containing protein [Acetobacter fallax]
MAGRFACRLAVAVAGSLVTGAFAEAQTVSPVCDNSGFLAAQRTFENGGMRDDVPVHVCGRVIAVSHKARRTRSGWHGYFYMDTGNGVSIRIVSDLDEMNAPDWPWVSKGDQTEVVGRYYYDKPRRQGIDWTHHGTGRSWGMPGYVIVNGTKYQ